MEKNKYTIQALHSDGSVGPTQIEVGLDDYQAAAARGMTLTEHLNTTYATNAAVHGTAMEQVLAQSGLFLRQAEGVRPPSMAQVLGMQVNMGAVTRPDASKSNTPSGRLFFPEIVLQAMFSELTVSEDDFLGAYDRMIATTQSVTEEQFVQPKITVTAPEGSRAQPISQLAEPAHMVGITAADTTRRIPTKSIGLVISDQAQRASTLDLVRIIMASQARGERIAMVEQQLGAMINGDADMGEAALVATTMHDYDSSLSSGSISHTAWIKWLRYGYKKRSINYVLCDIDTALKVENRSGKPVVTSDNPNSPRIDATFSVENLGVRPPRVLLLDTARVGANTMVGLDSRYAIRRVVNVNAAYSAIEQFVLRRATAFRIDFGEIAHKLFDDAWQKGALVW